MPHKQFPAPTVHQVDGLRGVWRLTQAKPYPVNCYIIEHGDERILIDTGHADQPGQLLEAVRSAVGQITAILLTHGHRDHVGALAEIEQATGVPIYAHPDEIPYIMNERYHGALRDSWWFLQPKGPSAPAPVGPVRPLRHGDRLGPLTACHTPGHSPGHLAFYHAERGIWFCGDLLATMFGRVTGPIWFFTYDLALTRRSARRLLESGPVRALCAGHGDPLIGPMEERITRYLRRHNAL